MPESSRWVDIELWVEPEGEAQAAMATAATTLAALAPRIEESLDRGA